MSRIELTPEFKNRVCDYVEAAKPSVMIMIAAGPHRLVSTENATALAETTSTLTAFRIPISFQYVDTAETNGSFETAMNIAMAEFLVQPVHKNVTHVFWVNGELGWRALDLVTLLMKGQPIVCMAPPQGKLDMSTVLTRVGEVFDATYARTPNEINLAFTKPSIDVLPNTGALSAYSLQQQVGIHCLHFDAVPQLHHGSMTPDSVNPTLVAASQVSLRAVVMTRTFIESLLGILPAFILPPGRMSAAAVHVAKDYFGYRDPDGSFSSPEAQFSAAVKRVNGGRIPMDTGAQFAIRAHFYCKSVNMSNSLMLPSDYAKHVVGKNPNVGKDVASLKVNFA